MMLESFRLDRQYFNDLPEGFRRDFRGKLHIFTDKGRSVDSIYRLGGERFPLAPALGVKIGPHQIFVHSLSFPGLPGENEAGPIPIRERPCFYDSLRVISAFFSPLWAKKKQEIFLRFPAFC